MGFIKSWRSHRSQTLGLAYRGVLDPIYKGEGLCHRKVGGRVSHGAGEGGGEVHLGEEHLLTMGCKSTTKKSSHTLMNDTFPEP